MTSFITFIFACTLTPVAIILVVIGLHKLGIDIDSL